MTNESWTYQESSLSLPLPNTHTYTYHCVFFDLKSWFTKSEFWVNITILGFVSVKRVDYLSLLKLLLCLIKVIFFLCFRSESVWHSRPRVSARKRKRGQLEMLQVEWFVSCRWAACLVESEWEKEREKYAGYTKKHCKHCCEFFLHSSA